ncbi:MRC1-like domain-containing protein [Annulohypoxylon maeteangense]|uniref:MRC1-like domain-containing protein n=1 Tax=Annulohypoxylon maeteangense TaxID=1927788 RepID=UPI002008B815|nr:MRC1-like domain-containing protein [Annulohypoxylon maeteangense]KAI0885501.1 MRC1-like domain-containing protein [Annulohypoxylon maeteangense]
MASTRSPSPAEGTSAPTSPQLSPRSKIKALLATVSDADSDDESVGPIDLKTISKSAERNIINSKVSVTQDDESDEEEEEIVRPRGRLAGRMRAEDTNKSVTNIDNNGGSPNSDDDGEEDINALPRRRLARPNRQATPEISANPEKSPSPGLFVTPAPETPGALRQSAAESDTDDELPPIAGKSERFMALLAKKREERLAKEAEKKRKDQERAERMAEQVPADDEVDDVSDITDDDGGRKLTQDVSRPAARKASKKALEEMNRETQRISRSMQLAHEAKTKKKITKDSLFERFNYKRGAAPKINKPTSSSRPTTPGSQHTDADVVDAGTPPSSPPVAPKSVQDNDATPKAPATSVQLDVVGEEDDELPSLEDVLAQSKKQDKGKGKAIEPTVEPAETKTVAAKPGRQIRVKMPPTQANLVTIDSDDELEITSSKKGRMDSIFNKLPEKKAQESNSMNVLRRLAHLSSPPREPKRGRRAKPSMTPAELQMSLQQRARAQAKLERDRRLEFLRSKGINVQSEEERQRERDQVEDIVARARQEVEEIMQREREDAKKARKERKEKGEDDPLAWDDSDDDSYEESEKEEPVEIELSGSEEGDEDDEMDDAENEDEDEPTVNPMFEDEAEENGESEEEQTPKVTRHIVSDDEAEDELPAMRSRRPKKHVQIVSDDEDENGVEATPKPKATHWKSPSAAHLSSPKIPTSVLRSATKTFIPGLPVPLAGPAGLGLTQIFAGTMDDSQIGTASGSPMQFTAGIDNFPDSQFSATAGQSQNDMVTDSQKMPDLDTQARETQTQGVQLHFSQSQVHGFDSLMQINATQMTEFIEPTQDGGFQDFSPLKQRFIDAPQSTVETVLHNETPDYTTIQESPLVKRGGRLVRRRPSTLVSSTLANPDIPGSPSPASKDIEMGANAAASAFKVMEKAAKRKKRMQEKFDKKKSKANEMVEEQAEESEDEYAGLGGADGEDSSDEDEELVKEMIDDAAGNNANDAKLAGFFADRERAADAAQVDKLFHDITTGMLRKRRRGGGNHDYDLSDSDDGGEARRRMKRRQFAKMQKALYADERIVKIAENSRNAAFLKSIEDLASDSDYDSGDNVADSAHESTSEESQNQEQSKSAETAEQSIPDSQLVDGRKRAHEDDHAARPPPNVRRTRGGVRPTSITDVRRELSDLLDEPNGSAASIIPATEIGSDGEDEERPRTASSNKENRTPDVAVVDRIKMKRDSSSLSTASNSRLAFAAPSASGTGGFKVPALLRRATTNSLMSSSSTSSSGASTPAGNAPGLSAGKAGEDGKLLKKTAGKRSGVNYFARETERRAAVADAEKRREAKKWKGAEGRGKVVGGLFGGGKFE